MAASPQAATAVCAHCHQFLKVDHVVGESLQRATEHPSLSNLAAVISAVDTPVTIITVRVQRFRKNADNCKCFHQLKGVFNQIFRMPRVWWSDWCRRSGGFFGSEDTFNDNDQLDGHNSWFRCDVKQIRADLVSDIDKAGGKDYTWWKMNVFVRWDAVTHRSLVLVLDPLEIVEQEFWRNNDSILRLMDAQLLARMKTTCSPYYVPSLFMEASVHFHNKAVMGTRDLVRDIEKDHERKNIHDPSSSRLHPGLRHVIHVTEMLETMLTITSQMLEAHNLFVEENLLPAPPRQGSPGTLSTAPADVLNHQVVFRIRNATVALRTLFHRAQSNSTRLHNEVTLSSHVLSADIAKAAQVDNSIMKTLGYLGTAFLPATFIAALFSMSFFGTDNNGNWIWHTEMWYYFIITFPLTVGVVIWTWYGHPLLRQKREDAARAKREAKLNDEEKRKSEAQKAARVESESKLRSPLSPVRFLRNRTFSGGGDGTRFGIFHRTPTQHAAVPSPTTAQTPIQLGTLVPLAKQQSTTTRSTSAASASGSGLGISNSAGPVPRGDQAV